MIVIIIIIIIIIIIYFFIFLFFLKSTNNNYKKHQKVNKKIENYLKIIIQTDKKLLLRFWLAHFPM